MGEPMPDPTRGPDWQRLRDQRALDPGRIRAAAEQRRRRPLLGPTGRFFLVAADHPARGALGVRQAAAAMGDRLDMLARLVTALSRPGVDGVLATPDVIEDLLLLGVLDDKIVIGSMNRGGLQESRFELDDRFTAFDVDSIDAAGYDGGKMLCRIDPDDPDTARALESCARAVGGLAERGLMAMLEPFWSGRDNGVLRNRLDTDSVVRSIHIAQALGPTSAYTWLKLPVVDDMERVLSATTLPVVLLGGDPTGRPGERYDSWQKALSVPGVRGLVAGRSLLYPENGDVAAAVDIAVSLLGLNTTG